MAALQLAKASYFILRIVVAFEDVKSRRSHDFSCGKAHARRLASLEVERVLGEGEKPRPDCTPGQLRAQEKSREHAVHVQGFTEKCNIIVSGVDCRAPSARIGRAGDSKSRIT